MQVKIILSNNMCKEKRSWPAYTDSLGLLFLCKYISEDRCSILAHTEFLTEAPENEVMIRTAQDSAWRRIVAVSAVGR